MKTLFWTRMAPLVAALALVVPAALAAAQRGEDIGRQIEREYGVVGTNSREGRALNAQLDEVVDRIVRAVNQDRRNADFRLQSAKLLGGRSEKHDKVVNAFALPDGRIYVTLGLMRLIQNSPRADDELAFVVAHEVTHVTEKHSQRQMKQSLPYNIGAILLGAITKSRDAATLGGLAAAAKTSSYSRRHEYDADKGGLLAMHRAGYDPAAAIAMLKRLEAEGGRQNKTINGIWGSHPITENRVNRVREMIDDLGSGRAIRDDR